MSTKIFRIYQVTDAGEKGERNTYWEVICQLEIGETVKIPIKLRSDMVKRSVKHPTISIRTLLLPYSKKKIMVIRIEKRKKRWDRSDSSNKYLDIRITRKKTLKRKICHHVKMIK